MLINPRLKKLDRFDRDNLPFGFANDLQEFLGDQRMDHGFQLTQGSRIAEDDPAELAAVDLPIIECQV